VCRCNVSARSMGYAQEPAPRRLRIVAHRPGRFRFSSKPSDIERLRMARRHIVCQPPMTRYTVSLGERKSGAGSFSAGEPPVKRQPPYCPYGRRRPPETGSGSRWKASFAAAPWLRPLLCFLASVPAAAASTWIEHSWTPMAIPWPLCRWCFSCARSSLESRAARTLKEKLPCDSL